MRDHDLFLDAVWNVMYDLEIMCAYCHHYQSYPTEENPHEDYCHNHKKHTDETWVCKDFTYPPKPPRKTNPITPQTHRIKP